MNDDVPERRAGLKTALVFLMLFAVLGAVVVFGILSAFSRPITTIILIRHAEKVIDPNDADPDLSPAGQARAQELVRMFGEAGINAIYATQYKRTQQTVKPLADKLGLPIVQVNSKGTPELLNQIRSQHAGQLIFVSGHNSTVPEIIAALGGPTFPTIPESEYDHLYIVTLYRTGKAKVVQMRYGSSSPGPSATPSPTPASSKTPAGNK
jgi:2,3-bisphosphoglycerate-dependent phosphoglycerate mutase